MSSAPIILFVYNRPVHTKKTLEALKLNKLASESILYIYSDGYKNEKDKNLVYEVRKYISTISGFKDIQIIQRDKNLGLANSVISGVNEVLKVYEKVVILEDDIVTSPYFLEFINEALDFYKEDKKIFSISGYSFPIKLPKSYHLNYFVAYRTSSWGWGTWKNRWEKLIINPSEEYYIQNPARLNAFLDKAGTDLAPMLLKTIKGKTNSWAVRWAFTHIKNDAFCLFPSKSLVKNIGTDASGVNFISKTNKYKVEISNSNISFNFASSVQVSNKIQARIKRFFRPGIISFIKYRLFKII